MKKSGSATRRQFLQTTAGLGAIATIPGCQQSSVKSDEKVTQAITGKPLAIPPLLDYTQENDSTKIFRMQVVEGELDLMEGPKTRTMGYNGNFLGPTIRCRSGDPIRVEIENHLPYVTTNHWHGLHLPAKQDGGPHHMILPGEVWTSQWTVKQEAATFWYHPHMMHQTGQQVYQGMAGFFIVDTDAGDQLGLPSEYGVDDIPLVIQDRLLDTNNQFNYRPKKSDDMGMKGPHILINGAEQPLWSAPAQWVRLRLLNGSNARIYNIGFEGDLTFYQSGTDGGALEQPVALQRLRIGPGERAEVLVDLAPLQGKQLKVMSFSSEIMATMNAQIVTKDHDLDQIDQSDYVLMTISVDQAKTANAMVALPKTLIPIEWIAESSAVNRERPRPFRLNVMNGFFINRRTMDLARLDFFVRKGDTEVWEIINTSWMAHPFHVHDVQFQVLDRIDTQSGKKSAPYENERGWKDTVYVEPWERVRIIMQFKDYHDANIPYMVHCHILEHEDDGMMQQFVILDPNEKLEPGFTMIKGPTFCREPEQIRKIGEPAPKQVSLWKRIFS